MNINVNENSDGERKEEELDEGQQPAKVEPEDGNSQKNEKEEKPKEDKNINNKKDDEVVGDGDDEDRGTVDDGSPSPSMADPNDIKDEEECKEGETCPQIMKNINEQYLDYRETAKTMIYMIGELKCIQSTEQRRAEDMIFFFWRGVCSKIRLRKVK